MDCAQAGRAVRPRAGGTFYAGATSRGLPPPLNDGMGFFRAALEQKVITVPGEFFDVNPGKRRSGRASRFRNYVRFSFGPEEEVVVEGVRRIQRMVEESVRPAPSARCLTLRNRLSRVGSNGP